MDTSHTNSPQPTSYQSLIKAQQRPESMGTARATSAADMTQKHSAHNNSAAEGTFSQHLKQDRSRTAGTMPVFDAKSASQSYSELSLGFAGGEDISIEDYLGQAGASSDSDVSHKKYTRASNPDYADVTIGDFVDIINPLHHIPLVNTIYREVTGDEIKPPARILGGGIFGGPLGMASAMVNSIVEDQTGNDIGGNVVSMITGDETTASHVQASPSSSSAPTYSSFAPIGFAQRTGSAQRTVLAAQESGNQMMSDGTSFTQAKQFLNDENKHEAAPQQKTTEVEDKTVASLPQNVTAPLDIEWLPQIESDKRFSNLTTQDQIDFDEMVAGDASLAKGLMDNSPYARAFAAREGAGAYEAATKAYGSDRTTGEMPIFDGARSSFLFGSNSEASDLMARDLDMDLSAARTPVTKMNFD